MLHRRNFHWVLLLILSLAGLMYLLGNDRVSLWDRDEPRYAQTSRQMLQSGDWVVPHFLDTIRTAKPVFIYWCQAASMSVLGDNAFAARFPSVLAMLCTLAVLAYAIRNLFGSRRALWTVFILATTGLAIGSAKMCLTDSVLLFWITLSQLCMFKLWRDGPSLPAILLMGVSIGFAGLTKGPVAPAVNILTAVALFLLGKTVRKPSIGKWNTDDFPTIVPIVLLLVLVICFPWLWEINWRAPQFLSTAIGHDVIERVRKGQEGHAWPPGFYLITIWATYFPWSLLIPATAMHAWKNRHRAETRFALAAIIGPWVMFELVVGKLWHYILPVFPFMAFLTANMLMAAARGLIPEFRQRLFRTSSVVWGCGVALAGLGPWALDIYFKHITPMSATAATMFAIAMIVFGVCVARSFWQGCIIPAAATMGGGMCVVIAIFYSLWCPSASYIRLSQRLADDFTAHGAYAAPGMMIDYKEASLSFHQGGGLIEQFDNDFLLHAPPSDWPQWLTITTDFWQRVPAETQSKWEIIASQTGWNYAGQAKMKEVLVLKKK